MHGSQVQFSIVIPAYDSRDTIRRCLESVLSEFDSGHQIIVVDDGCKHDCTQLVADLPVTILENVSNLGAGAARNRGIGQAQHGWMLFVDADVIIKPGTNRILQDAIRAFPNDVSFGSVSDIIPANSGLFQEFLACRAHFQYASGPYYCTAFPSQLVAVKKDIFDRVGLFSEQYVTSGGEEFEMGNRLSQSGIRTRILPDFQFYHVYADFGKRCKKYFYRSKIFFRLFKVHGQFETVIASLMETIRSLYTLFGLLGFFLFPSIPYLIAYLVIFLLLDQKFYRFLLKRKGFLFAAYSAAMNFVIFIAIALGGIVAALQDIWNSLLKR